MDFDRLEKLNSKEIEYLYNEIIQSNDTQQIAEYCCCLRGRNSTYNEYCQWFHSRQFCDTFLINNRGFNRCFGTVTYSTKSNCGTDCADYQVN